MMRRGNPVGYRKTVGDFEVRHVGLGGRYLARNDRLVKA